MMFIILAIDTIIEVVVVIEDVEAIVQEISENQQQEILGATAQEIMEIIGAIMVLVHLPLGIILIDNKVQIALGGKEKKNQT